MKKFLFLSLIVACAAVSVLQAQTCSTVSLATTSASECSSGGTCIKATCQTTCDGSGRTAGLFQMAWINPGHTDTCFNYDPGMWQGVGNGICICDPPSVYSEFVDYTTHVVMQSGASFFCRELKFWLGEYPNTGVAYQLYRNDESAWGPWSNHVTVTYPTTLPASTGGATGKPPKPGKGPKK